MVCKVKAPSREKEEVAAHFTGPKTWIQEVVNVCTPRFSDVEQYGDPLDKISPNSTVNAPDFITCRKLNRCEPAQDCDGWPPGVSR